jgi:16S rRNA (cytosine1402-N4)-methyltransferase
MPPPLLVSAGVILRSGGVLLARRAPGRRHAGQWEFPGGRVEPGESPQEALKRELREELGIEAVVGEEVSRTRHAYDDGEIELAAFFVKQFTGTPTLKDHDQLAWVTARDLPRYDLVPADVPVAEKVAAHRRRDRYTGTHPKSFTEKYKELAADPDAVAKAKARGSTPAGTHLPVMLAEVLEALAPLESARVLDCTLGWGGHAAELARRAGPKGSLIALDRDGEELARTEARLRAQGLGITARQCDYAGARAVLGALGWTGVDALLADLGVSSMQLDRPDRGMSLKFDGPLDMRMDRSRGLTAAQWLRTVGEARVAEALARFGDEPDAAKIAAALARLAAEGRSPKTTRQLAAAVTEAKGLGKDRVRKTDAFAPHPATRTFQALRIAVNSERESLSQLLRDLPALLRPGGRAAFLTFHSGEETLVGKALAEQAAAGLWRAPLEAPRKPSPAEVKENPRARSARLWRAVRA